MLRALTWTALALLVVLPACTRPAPAPAPRPQMREAAEASKQRPPAPIPERAAPQTESARLPSPPPAPGPALAAAPDPAPAETVVPVPSSRHEPSGRVELYEMFRPSRPVKAECERLGFQPLPHLTKSRLVNREFRFDGAAYMEKIWTPDVKQRTPADAGGAEKFGIPPGWTGLVCLDLEAPVWDPIRRPNEFTDLDIARATQIFLDVAAATKRLRPQARIMFHNIMLGGSHQRALEAQEQIGLACDAVSPSMYLTAADTERSLKLHELRLRHCLRFKKEHGRAVYPVVSKRYHTGGRALMPQELFRRVVEMCLLTEEEGVRADGICLWGNDNNQPALRPAADETDLAAMRIIVEVARQRDQGAAAGQDGPRKPPSGEAGLPSRAKK